MYVCMSVSCLFMGNNDNTNGASQNKAIFQNLNKQTRYQNTKQGKAI